MLNQQTKAGLRYAIFELYEDYAYGMMNRVKLAHMLRMLSMTYGKSLVYRYMQEAKANVRYSKVA